MRRLSGEKGYTLTELLVVIAIFGMISAAVYWVFDVSQKTYIRASSLEDAQLGARVGLERMASEFRAIGAYWVGVTGAGSAITAASATSITFVGDVDADTVSAGVETTLSADASAGTTMNVSGTAAAFNTYSSTTLNDFVYVAYGATREVRQLSKVSGTTLTLSTALTSSYLKDSIVRSVETVTYIFDSKTSTITRKLGGVDKETLVENVTDLTLKYFDAASVETADLSLIQEIQISLTTKGSDGSLRTMASRVRPRNLSL